MHHFSVATTYVFFVVSKIKICYKKWITGDFWWSQNPHAVKCDFRITRVRVINDHGCDLHLRLEVTGHRWWLKRPFQLIIPARVWEWDHKAGWICSSSKLCEWQQRNGFTPSGTAFRRRSWSAGWRTNRFTLISDGFCIRPIWRRYC